MLEFPFRMFTSLTVTTVSLFLVSFRNFLDGKCLLSSVLVNKSSSAYRMSLEWHGLPHRTVPHTSVVSIHVNGCGDVVYSKIW